MKVNKLRMNKKIKNRGHLYKLTRTLCYNIFNRTKNINIEIPDKTLEIMLSEDRKIYSGLHKSMWETIGIPVILDMKKVKVPYIVVAKTLIGTPFRSITEHLGIIFVDTNNKIKGSIDMLEKIPEILKKHDILIFPEGTRTKTGLINDFSTPIFDIAKKYSENQETYIIPFNVDYNIVNDARDRIVSTKKYKFMTHHLLYWFKDLENIYVTFGKPIRVRNFENRKKLKEYTKEESSQLVKILPINIYSKAISILGKDFKEYELIRKINDLLIDLNPHKSKFREFKTIDDIVKSIKTTNDDLRIYSLYGNYINHYFDKYKI